VVEVLGRDGVLGDSESVDDSSQGVGDSGNDGDNEVHDGVVELLGREAEKEESAMGVDVVRPVRSPSDALTSVIPSIVTEAPSWNPYCQGSGASKLINPSPGRA